MNAYLFTGLVSEYYNGHFVDTCPSALLYGGEEDAAWKRFEQILLSRNRGENPTPAQIVKVVGAPVLDQLLTETGSAPIDWPGLCQEVTRVLESTPVEDQEQGYWVDCEQCVRPENLAPDLGWLQRELPEEIRSGLNWAEDKSYFFLISVLSPPGAPAEMVEETGEPMPENGQLDSPSDWELEQRQAAFPQMAEKELAVVVRARNSVVAAWLWRKYAASTRLVTNAIRIDALCDVGPVTETRG